MRWFGEAMSTLLSMKAAGKLSAADLLSGADFTSSKQPYGLSEVFNSAYFVMYDPNQYQGLTSADKAKFDAGRALAATIGSSGYRQVVLSENIFRRESDSWFWQSKVNIDTAGQLVHEMFHVAGFSDNLFGWFKVNGKSLNDSIHEHCGITGATMR